MQTQIYPTADGFAALSAEWNELLQHSAADTIFLTHQWQSIWWRHLGDGTPMLIAFRDESGRLVGLAPLYGALTGEGEWALNTIGCVDVSDYLDIITRRGREQAVYAALLDLLDAPDAFDFTWDALDLCNVPQNSPTLELLGPMAAARGYQVTSQMQDVCPIVTLPGSWDDYLAGLASKDRRELRRKLRKANPHAGVEWYIVGSVGATEGVGLALLEQNGLLADSFGRPYPPRIIEKVRPEHDLPAEMEKFLHLMAFSHPDKAEFLHAEHRAFIHAIAQAAWAAGWLELAFLTIEGEPAATALNFCYHDRTLLYNSGLDAARFLRLSPGIVLTAFLIRHSIQAGREVFDFMRGDEKYKYQLGGVDTTIHRLLIRKPA